jgi:AcrR family transcriptional regulator
MSDDRARRDEILETAGTLFASSGLRTTLAEIADACGILPGSLYHHFDSKEAIIFELVQRYREDLDRVAKEALEEQGESVEDRVVGLGEAIAACAVKHRAALLYTLYEPPTAAGEELRELARQAPVAIDAAMVEILDGGAATGAIRSGIDLTLFAERICQSMLHVGVGVFHRSRAGRHLPAEKCRLLLHGVAVKMPTEASLDRSDAMRAANAVIATWDRDDEGDDRVLQLRAVARAEFGRHGYESTTIRDIAKAAGVSTGSVYRLFASKDELLLSIMETFAETIETAWEDVLESDATSVEKLDGLMWINANLLDRFSDEFKIQIAWFRQSPPTSVDLGLSFGHQIQGLKKLLNAGIQAGELQVEGSSDIARARSLYELMLIPVSIVRSAGVRTSQSLARETLLRGAGKRS